MTNEDAIKYLQQIYPNGGHCWLDEQRIEAIGMAVKALQKEPVNKDLLETSKQYALRQVFASTDTKMSEQAYLDLRLFSGLELAIAHKDGAQWQKEQFEKNRLVACKKQTEKEAEIEAEFIMNIIENEHRQPTYDDAIKYGMKLKEQQLMANTVDATIGLPYENKDGGFIHLVDVSRPLPVGDNKIAIIFKED